MAAFGYDYDLTDTTHYGCDYSDTTDTSVQIVYINASDYYDGVELDIALKYGRHVYVQIVPDPAPDVFKEQAEKYYKEVDYWEEVRLRELYDPFKKFYPGRVNNKITRPLVVRNFNSRRQIAKEKRKSRLQNI